MERFKEFIEEKKIIVLGGLFLLIFVIQGFMFCYFYFEDDVVDEPLKDDVILKDNEDKNDEEVILETKFFYVDVKGEVKKPGTYKLEEGKRVIDAIKSAGGLTKNADTSVNNLSLKIKDEMVIVIYSKDDVINFTKVKEKEALITENCNKKSNDVRNDTCIQDNNSDDLKDSKLISINTASLEELMTVNGIGEAKAISIIEYREKNGLFKDISEIKNVSGIGEALYEKIKDYITT